MKTKLICATTVLALVVCVTHAARMLPLTIQQLTDKARLVVHGNVTKKTVQRDAEGRSHSFDDEHLGAPHGILRVRPAVFSSWQSR